MDFEYSNRFKRKSAINKKIYLEKVKVHNKKTMFIKELAGAMVLISMAGGIVGMVKAMVDDYSRNKYQDKKSATQYQDEEIESKRKAKALEKKIRSDIDDNLHTESLEESHLGGKVK